MLARAARPKLALAVPTLNTSAAAAASHSAARSPLPRTPISPSPISPTVRNTRLNQRGFSTMQPPTFAYSQSSSNTKSILKKGQTSSRSSSSSSAVASNKKLSFKEEPSVRCVSPVPEDYHGTYLKISRDERRWGKGNGYRE